MSQPWRSGIFGCFEDVPQCVLGWCCPCYLFGQNSERFSGADKIKMTLQYAVLSCCCLSCIIHKPHRESIRNTYGLEENPNDWLATCCCSSCANCQEAAQLKYEEEQPSRSVPVSAQPH